MNQSEQNSLSVEKTSQPSSGPYTLPPPIGYPTRDAMVGDPPAAAVETKSKGVEKATKIVENTGKGIEACCECLLCCLS
ncbi:PREDICTED: cysteine-rich and transmembrane domain-containing protein PCC1-like [Camelina sativa]|nr:PREDICTED: cysteine-rich and transmembrane domain-containing protein PCC1-like [Camelina sativa]